MAGAHPGLAGVRYGLPSHHVRGWSQLALAWLQFHPQDLKDNPRPELENLLRYLKVEIDQGRMDCIEAHLEGKFHRGERKDQEDQEINIMKYQYITCIVSLSIDEDDVLLVVINCT